MCPPCPRCPLCGATAAMLTMHCAVLRPAAWGPLTVAAPILAMRSWCWQRIDDMRAGVHQKPYMSLEVEVAGTALVGGTCASIRPTPAIMCMVLQRRRAVHAVGRHVGRNGRGTGRNSRVDFAATLAQACPNFS